MGCSSVLLKPWLQDPAATLKSYRALLLNIFTCLAYLLESTRTGSIGISVKYLLDRLQNGSQDAAQESAMEAEQAYIALIDLSCNEEFLELVKSSLLAVIESLPGNARLGLITFSTKACPDVNIASSKAHVLPKQTICPA